MRLTRLWFCKKECQEEVMDAASRATLGCYWTNHPEQRKRNSNKCYTYHQYCFSDDQAYTKMDQEQTVNARGLT